MVVTLLATASLLAAGALAAVVGPAHLVRPTADRCPPPTAFHASADAARLLRPQDRRGDAGAQTLNSLPPANLELAVERRVAGCSVPTVVREQVQGDGRFAK